MRPTLGSGRLLNAWEQASGLPPLRRALALLDQLDEDARCASVGECERRLLRVRQRLFGDAVDAVAACPECNQTIEVSFRVSQVLGLADAAPPVQPLESEGLRVRWRLPTCAEVVEMAADDVAGGSPVRRTALFERCLVDVRGASGEQSRAPLSDEISQAVAAAMSASDPLANLHLEVSCPACRQKWQAPFDAGGYLWRELDQWAQRMLSEIHCLAHAYGWSEAEILALPSPRRQAYLKLVGA